jgi:prepilin-type N-terminal cleavage/methylation domain-containing protein
MILTRGSGSSRSGFTLTELIIVIAIIAILVGLTTAAVMMGFRKADEVETRNDIQQLELAINAFKTHYNVKNIPSKLRLRENTADYYNPSATPPADPLDDAYSVKYLTQIWPRRRGGAFIDWDADGVVNTNNPAVFDLEGDQCLVFFLGGIPAAGPLPGVSGFSTDASNPAAHRGQSGAGISTAGPFFEFKNPRLVALHPNSPRFYSYLDPYKSAPFAFFSATAGDDYRAADCLTIGAMPYKDLSGKFWNPRTFQIISAGFDGQFNPPVAVPPEIVWPPPTGPATIPGSIQDNLTNFHTGLMGRPE